MGEHNLALMLLFYFRNCPIPYLRIKLYALLDESPFEYADASADALPHDPALDVLYASRQKEVDVLLHNTPNLGDVQRVDVKEIADKPSGEFLRFLTDWYNGLEDVPED